MNKYPETIIAIRELQKIPEASASVEALRSYLRLIEKTKDIVLLELYRGKIEAILKKARFRGWINF